MSDLWDAVVPTVRKTAEYQFACEECLDTGTIDRGGAEIVCPYCGGASAESSRVEVTEPAGSDTLTIKITGLGWGLGARGGSDYSTCTAFTASTMTFTGTRGAILNDVLSVRRQAETEARGKGLSGRNSVSSGAIAIEKRVRAALGTTSSKRTAYLSTDWIKQNDKVFMLQGNDGDYAFAGEAGTGPREYGSRAWFAVYNSAGSLVAIDGDNETLVHAKSMAEYVLARRVSGHATGAPWATEADPWLVQGSKTAMPAPVDMGVAVGDIFYNSWGYDQTNVDFYEVIRLTGQGVEVQPIGSRIVSSGSGSQSVVAAPGMVRDFDVILGISRGDTKRSKVCRLKEGWQGTPAIVLKSGQYSAYKWDGRPMHETDAYSGH